MSQSAANMSLAQLLEGMSITHRNGSGALDDIQIADISLDSRAVTEGGAFFALPGLHAHGLQFANDAVARGARVVLWDAGDEALPEPAAALPASVFVARVPGLKSSLGRIADRFFSEPSAQMRVTGVTGTNGKTTTAYLLAQCFELLGVPAAYMGTLGWGRPTALQSATHTTPDVFSVHRKLAQLRSGGVREVAMEVSSHALDQGRVEGVRFCAAAFTNLSRDHLDYHGTMQAYGDAKLRLFAWPDLKQMVINIGDDFGRNFLQQYTGSAPATAVWVGSFSPRLGQAEHPQHQSSRVQHTLWVEQMTMDKHGMRLQLQGSYGEAVLSTQLIGKFNAENSVVVLACLISLGVSLQAAAEVLARCVAPPGRMELLKSPQDSQPLAVIDYAHTPDALAKALGVLREHCHGALWCVFGCGGDRDAGKRPLMGAIADDLADQIIITDDNPRSENPQHIVADIVGGIRVHTPRVIHDRARAIATAIAEALPRDAVLIAGKGHERTQTYGSTARSFSDRHEVLRCFGVAA